VVLQGLVLVYVLKEWEGHIKLNGNDHSPAPNHGKLVKDDAGEPLHSCHSQFAYVCPALTHKASLGGMGILSTHVQTFTPIIHSSINYHCVCTSF